MKIITPSQSGVMPPSGIVNNYSIGGLKKYAEYSYSADQSSNYTATDFFFTPENGVYILCYFLETTVSSGSASGFGLAVSVKQGASSFLSGGINLEVVGSNNGGGAFQLIIAADGDVEIERNASSYSSGTAHAIVTASAYKIS